MKVFVQALLLGGALLLATESQAQSRPAPRRTGAAPRPRPKTSGVMIKDGATMKDGKVLLTEQGLTTPLTQDKTLVNGTVITASGQVTNPGGGAAVQLAEGDMVSLTGRLTTRREMVEADSVRKLVDYDLKHPGKRKEMEKAREKAEKAKEKADKEKAKQKAKAGK